MPNFRLNLNEINEAVVQNKDVQARFREIAQQKLAEQKNNLIEEFDEHPVTQELERGSEADNTSGTLGGYGNLFSFIGFGESSKPTESVRNLLRSKIKLGTANKPKIGNREFSLSYNVNVPTDDELANRSRMPWESGRSWLFDIEKGISGFSSFIFKKLTGRSGGGVQSKGLVHTEGFRPVSYWSKIWNNFRNNL